MAESVTIRIECDVKDVLEEFRDKHHRKTHSDAIQHLIKYYHANEIQKQEDRKKREADLQKQKETLVHLGSEVKPHYVDFLHKYGLKSESFGVAFLLEHFQNSDSFSKATLDFLIDLKS